MVFGLDKAKGDGEIASFFGEYVSIQGVSENTDTLLSLPALVLLTAQTLLGARINPWTLEIHIHRLSSPFEPLPGN